MKIDKKEFLKNTIYNAVKYYTLSILKSHSGKESNDKKQLYFSVSFLSDSKKEQLNKEIERKASEISDKFIELVEKEGKLDIQLSEKEFENYFKQAIADVGLYGEKQKKSK